jgi:hypothetical protein
MTDDAPDIHSGVEEGPDTDEHVNGGDPLPEDDDQDE